MEAQFNQLLDRCSDFREQMGVAADALSLGRAMELLSARLLAESRRATSPAF